MEEGSGNNRWISAVFDIVTDLITVVMAVILDI